MEQRRLNEMTTYTSNVKTISSSEEVVFQILSDLNNLQDLASQPDLSDKLTDLEFSSDNCSFKVDGIGKVGFRIIEKEAFKTIKFESEHIPVQANMWIQLKQVAENDTKLKLTFKAELPSMIKMMVDKKITKGIEAIADLLSNNLNARLNA